MAALILAAGLAVVTLVLLPPPAARAVASAIDTGTPVARGALHVHSNRSDGTGTLDEIAAAASAAGLQFVIVTDHGNGTREPEPPAYRAGVLCLDAVEISTRQGHLVALGLGRTPYPLAGEPRDVIEDVHRFGGMALAAHPGSPKAALRWEDWEAPFDGIEWLNADSEWRDEFWGFLGRVLLTYPVRPAETLAALLDRPDAVLDRWDALVRQRRVPAVAGADAHARLGLGQAADPYQDRIVARVPSYQVSFRAFRNHVLLDLPLNGEATRDAGLVLAAIRDGRVYSSVDGLAELGAFAASATSGAASARIGEYLDVRGPVVLEAAIAAPPETRLAVVRDGELLHETTTGALRIEVGSVAGAYRIEAYLPDAHRGSASVPWLLTNPVYVGLREAHRQAEAARRAARPAPATARTPFATPGWRAEASDGSASVLTTATLEDGTPALGWTFALAGGEPRGQFAAMRFPVDGGLAGHDRIQMRLRADTPRRLWVQLRTPGAGGRARWGATFFAAASLQSVELPFTSFRPLDTGLGPRPPLDQVDSVLLVADTLNSLPGASGSLSITDLWLAR